MQPGALPLPTFLIIGAQKSATRWLRFNLGLHPDVYAAPTELYEAAAMDGAGVLALRLAGGHLQLDVARERLDLVPDLRGDLPGQSHSADPAQRRCRLQKPLPLMPMWCTAHHVIPRTSPQRAKYSCRRENNGRN